MASLLLGNLGSSLLGPLGGWIGSAIGSYIDNMLFSPKPEDQKGPRLDDLNVTRADPGVPIPLVYGADRVPGIVIASTALIETINKEKVGGKGGGPKQTVITYTYHVTIDYMLCEGPVLGVARIWAEGNLVRGTRYEMETDTAEHPEKIGGIPYPDYYKDHLYDPNLIPWTQDRTVSPYDEGFTYKKTADNLSMVRVSAAEATDILANKIDVLYWKDTSTGYYIPLHNDHAYGYDKNVRGRPPETQTFIIEYDGAEGVGNSAALRKFWTVVDLQAFMSKEDIAKLGDYGAQLHVTPLPITSVANEYSFGAFVGTRYLTVEYSNYKDGNVGLVDGEATGDFVGGSYWQYTVDEFDAVLFGHQADGLVQNDTRFIYIATTYTLAFPIFAGALYWAGGTIELTYTRTFDADEEDVRDWPDYWNLYDAITDWSAKAVLTFKGADNVTFYHGTMNQTPNAAMRSALLADLEDNVDAGTFAVPAYIGRSHIVFDTLQLADFGNRIPNLTFEVVQYDDVRIAAVIRDMMRRAEVDEIYYDTSLLPSVGQASHVLGYSIGSKTTYRAAMETLMEAFRIDAGEIGNEFIFRERDRDVDWIVDWMDLAADEPGRKPDEKVEIFYRDKIEMPRTFTVRFKDVERNYQVNTAQYFRQQGPSVQESMAELAAVLPPEHAKAYARDKMRDVWLERVSVKLQLPHKYVYIGATDIVKINGADYGASDIVFKVDSLTRGANGVLEIEGKMRADSVYHARAGEVTRTRMNNSLWNHRPTVQPSPTYVRTDFLDIAPLTEEDAAPGAGFGFYVAMSGGTGWRGAGLYASADNGSSYTQIAMGTTRAVAGNAASQLPFHIAEYLDTTNYVDVDLIHPTDELENINSDQLYGGLNYCILGNEVMQFMTCEKLVGFRNRWRLSVLHRGRRGTDQDSILGGHRLAERFVIIQKDAVFKVPQSPTFLGQPQLFKVVPIGLSLADVAPITFTNTGGIRRAFAPVYLRGVRDASDNLSVQWIRQDKGGWGWPSNQDIVDTENTFSYVLEFLDPLGVTVMRTFNIAPVISPYDASELTVYSVNLGFVMADANDTSNPTLFTGDYLYTSAMQTADGYTPGDPVWVRMMKTYSGGLSYPTTARV